MTASFSTGEPTLAAQGFTGPGFTLWLAGPDCGQRIAWISWLSSLLTERGLRVAIVVAEDLWAAMADDGEGPERVARGVSERCSALLAEGRIPLVAEGCFSRLLRQQAGLQLGCRVRLALEAPAGVQPRPDFEPLAAPDLTIPADLACRAAVGARVFAALAARGLVPSVEADLQRDETLLIDRLQALGYL